MRSLRTPSRAPAQPSGLLRWPIHHRCVQAHYRMDGAFIAPPASSLASGLPQLDGLMFTQLARPCGILEGEPLQTLTQLAAANQSCQVLEAISKTALVLRDTAIAYSRGMNSAHSASIGLQALFQNGYDTLVALLQALPQSTSAYGPAAVLPETCVTLFHVHNLLLQAAYASQQDFDVWTELMQAGLELYLRRAPDHLMNFSCGQLELLLDALAHQDLWRLQLLLWQQMLTHIPAWDSMQDFCSVVQGCELAAEAATTAAAAAAAASGVAFGGSDSLTGLAPAGSLPVDADCGASMLPSGSGLGGCRNHTATDTAAAASVLYDKQAELAAYGSLMAECIRAALEGAASRGLAAAQQPHAAAQQLVEVVAGFEQRQRSPSALAALRYAFVPTPEWLSRVAAAGVQTDGQLSAAQVVKLLQDLDSLAPQPLDSPAGGEGVGLPNRWLDAESQAAVERAVLWHTASRAWSPQQAVSVVKALSGKCMAAPSEQLCGLVEGLLLAGDGGARTDVGLLCAVLQDAVDLASPGPAEITEGSTVTAAPPPALSPGHLSLVKLALNRASYLVESTAPSTDGAAAAAASTSYAAAPPGRERMAAGTSLWRSREFLFERYPRLLHAARKFGYPLQAFRTEEYADQLYVHLATSPGHELVAVGPEGLALVLRAVASTPCCRDPQWAAAFERACLTLVAVQFAVGYTHPRRWLGLLEATVSALAFPMPALAAAIKALLVRLCDTRRHAKYFWHVLPLVGALERRAAAAQHPQGSAIQGGGGGGFVNQRPLWSPVTNGGPAAGPLQNSPLAGKARATAKSASGGAQRRAAVGRGRGAVTAASSGGSAAAFAGGGTGLGPLAPPPDLSSYLVSEEEYSQWCEELGQRLALSMACLSDQDRVAQLSVFGIGGAAGQT